jgi:hypothetical protein
MTTAKPSKWKPGGIELFEVRELFTEESFARLSEMLGFVGQTRLKEFRTRILNVAGCLNVGLYFQARPTVPEKRAALGKIARPVRKALAAMETADEDTRQLLSLVAGQDPWDEQMESRRLLAIEDPQIGELRVNTAFRELQKIARWAEAGLGERGRAGQKTNPALHAAIGGMAEIWSRFSNQKLRLAPFPDFCRTALAPVLAARGVEVEKLSSEVQRFINR